jgi:hypothetical protein
VNARIIVRLAGAGQVVGPKSASRIWAVGSDECLGVHWYYAPISN